MNLIDAQVVEVLDEPKFHEWDDGAVSCWTIKVSYADMGTAEGVTDLQFDSKEAALEVKPGYVFQH